MNSLHSWVQAALLVSAWCCASTAASATNIYSTTDPDTTIGASSRGYYININDHVSVKSSADDSSTPSVSPIETDSLFDLGDLLSTDTGWKLTDALSANSPDRILWCLKHAAFRILPSWRPPPL